MTSLTENVTQTVKTGRELVKAGLVLVCIGAASAVSGFAIDGIHKSNRPESEVNDRIVQIDRQLNAPLISMNMLGNFTKDTSLYNDFTHVADSLNGERDSLISSPEYKRFQNEVIDYQSYEGFASFLAYGLGLCGMLGGGLIASFGNRIKNLRRN